MEIYLAAPEPVNKNRRAIVGSTKPQWRSISVACIAIQVLPINGTRKETSRRETMVPTVGGLCRNDLLRKPQLRLLRNNQPIPSQGADSIQCHCHGNGKGWFILRRKKCVESPL